MIDRELIFVCLYFCLELCPAIMIKTLRWKQRKRTMEVVIIHNLHQMMHQKDLAHTEKAFHQVALVQGTH